MKALLAFALALPVIGQTGIPCTLKLGSSVTMKSLYGGKTTVIQGRVSCKNYGIDPVGVSGVDVDLATPTLDTIPADDAQAMLTKTFNNQTGQRLTRDLTSGLGVLGIVELAFKAAKPVLNSTWVGIIITSFVSAVQYVIPSFTANEIPTNFNNQCDGISGITLASGQSLKCTIYINKPPKGNTQIPSAFGFTIGGAVTPGPPAPPVQLRQPLPGVSLPIDPRGVCVMGDTPVGDYPACPRTVTTSGVIKSRLDKVMRAHEAAYQAAVDFDEYSRVVFQ